MWAPGPSMLAPSAGGLSRAAHPEVLGGISERVQQLQNCGTGRKFEPRGGQEHGHVGGISSALSCLFHRAIFNGQI